jgi:hypothetical protein
MSNPATSLTLDSLFKYKFQSDSKKFSYDNKLNSDSEKSSLDSDDKKDEKVVKSKLNRKPRVLSSSENSDCENSNSNLSSVKNLTIQEKYYQY